MPLIHYTEKNIVRLISTETRRIDISPQALSKAHSALGRFLGGELVEMFPLISSDIQHVQGIRQGWKIKDEAKIMLLVFMRSGLYVAEGVRDVFQVSPMLHVTPDRSHGLNERDLFLIQELLPQSCILIDSVINTGASVEPVLGQLSSLKKQIFVLSLVSPISTALRLTDAWPDVQFLFARLSNNQYIGKGGSDTGHRLFGTIPPIKESS